MSNKYTTFKNRDAFKKKDVTNVHKTRGSRLPNDCSGFGCNWVRIEEDEKINEIKRILGEDII